MVFVDNKEPRLVLDSTVCQVNTRCYLPERLSLPMAYDLALATQARNTPRGFLGAFQGRPQTNPSSPRRGLLLFAFQGRLYHYRVCHFGGRFSAYSWQRTGAFLLRQVHGLLAVCGDLLCALLRAQAPEMFALVALFFCAVAAPISWKKAQFQDCLVWCGLEINFATPSNSCRPSWSS